ncbi:21156_t:CDS:2, partial [Entrophospora sp. SA101]
DGTSLESINESILILFASFLNVCSCCGGGETVVYCWNGRCRCGSDDDNGFVSYGIVGGRLSLLFDEPPYGNKKEYNLSSHINKKDLAKLTELTWCEINEHVQRGAYLVVCDGFIVNVRKWIKVHPGGAKILEHVIGTDITNDFFGYKGKEIIEQINLPAIKSIKPVPTGISTSVLAQYTDILHERTKKYTTERNSVAQVVDDMNCKYFLKAPLAIHPHNLFAIKKMATMVVAKLKESPDVESSILPVPTIPPMDVNNINIDSYEIQVRGPFDVGDREVLQTPLSVDATSQYRKSSLLAKNIPSFISSSTTYNIPFGIMYET